MIEYLTIRGKKYPFKVGYYVFKKIKEKTGLAWSEALKDKKLREDMELHEIILYAALKTGAWEEGEELDLREDEMEMALSSCFVEYLGLIASGKFYPQGFNDLEGKLRAEEESKKPKSKKPKRKK